ncbi:hypothetical protein JTB14_021825 [Gonioctena quinquepunctata]|nr:hypothetical protein JTB14_021825 [Gonioctena quinquepunctata]
MILFKTAIDTYEQMEHVPHHEAVETLSRNTKLSRSKDPLTEVSMSWSNRSGNRIEVNTEVNAFTPVCSYLSKEQSHAEDQLNTLTSTPKREILISRASDSMKAKYPNVIGSLDCTEFFIQRPSSFLKQSQCYSNYKGATTLESLIMIEPAGAIIYASPLFTGSISDKGIIEARAVRVEAVRTSTVRTFDMLIGVWTSAPGTGCVKPLGTVGGAPLRSMAGPHRDSSAFDASATSAWGRMYLGAGWRVVACRFPPCSASLGGEQYGVELRLGVEKEVRATMAFSDRVAAECLACPKVVTGDEAR